MSNPRAGVPLVVPSPSQLQAGAVWVTIANWADALAERFGSAPIVTPTATLTPQDARDVAFGGDRAGSPTTSRTHFAQLRALVKDVRWAYRGLRFASKIEDPGLWPMPFVWQHHDLFQRAGFRLACRRSVPLVLFVDAPQVWEARQWGVRRPVWGDVIEALGERPQLRDADVVACVSEEVAEAAVAVGARPDRILVTPCTADAGMFAAALPALNARPVGVDVVVGWVGSFRRFHNVPVLVRAVAALRREGVGIGLLLVGDGPTRAETEAMATELAVPATFTGQVPHREVPRYIRAFDAGVVLAAPDDAFHYSPLKLKEYLAASCAAVAPRLGEMERTLTDGTDAALYSPRDEDGLECALRSILDEGARRSMAGAGRKLFEDCFRIDSQIDAVLSMLGHR